LRKCNTILSRLRYAVVFASKPFGSWIVDTPLPIWILTKINVAREKAQGLATQMRTLTRHARTCIDIPQTDLA
jgi:hypothetical protein